MTNNQATLHKLDQMRLHGMARALRTSLDSQGQWTADELLAHLVDAESDDRHARRLQRLLKAARFRYPARHRGGRLRAAPQPRPEPAAAAGRLPLGRSASGPHHHRQMWLREELPRLRAGPPGVSARVPGRLPCVLTAVRRTAAGQGRRQLRPGTGEDQQAGTADHR